MSKVRLLTGAAFALLVVAAADGAAGQEPAWTHAATGDSSTHYVDVESIRVVGDYVEYWDRVKYDGPRHVAGIDFDESKIHYRVDCAARRMANRYAVYYLDDRVTETGELSDEFTPVVPGSVGAGKLEFVCSRAGLGGGE